MKYSIIGLVFLTAACSTTSDIKKIEVETNEYYPVLPPVELPEKPILIAPNVDVPRDTSKPKVNGEYPPINNTNIFLGFDLNGWNTFIINGIKIKEYVAKLENRIEEVNKQRQEWRDKATKKPDEPAKSTKPVVEEKKGWFIF